MTNSKMANISIKELEMALIRNGFSSIEFNDVDLEVSEEFAVYDFRGIHTGWLCDIEIQVYADEELEIYAKPSSQTAIAWKEVTPSYNPTK